ncbi:MAG: hypothetical protein ACH36H_05320 [Candidatus Nanopelagicales bacterium]
MKRSALAASALLACVGLTACGNGSTASDAINSAQGQASSAVAAAQGAASSAAAAASSAVAQATSGVCQALSGVKADVQAQSNDQATVGQVKAAAQKSITSLNQAKADAGAVKGAVISAMVSAEQTLIDQLQGLPDDQTVAQASPKAQAAVTAVQGAYTTVTTTFNC